MTVGAFLDELQDWFDRSGASARPLDAREVFTIIIKVAELARVHLAGSGKP